jgi:hypothetical protein
VRDAADATVHVDALSGFRFSQAISSPKLFAGMVFAAKITSGPDTTSATVAARFQREHQWSAETVLSEGNRPVSVLASPPE